MGRNRGDERMSSILNCCPLIRVIHISGFRDRPAMRYALLDKVYERVSFSPYKLTDNDVAFMEHANDYLQTNGLPILYQLPL